jgi:flagellar biosynthesis protein FlhG
MDELARVRFDQSSGIVARRSSTIGRVRMLGAGRWHAPLAGRPGARFIAVRGRSGVGKSTVAANLAIALAGLRSRVVLIDLDLLHPTQHELFGIAAPVPGLKALLDEQIETIEQALTPTAMRNLYLVSAEGATPETRTANVEQQHRLLGQIWELDADVVIADVGTNPADDFVDMFELGAMRLVVSAPDPRSIRRAYNFFKDQVLREVEHVAGGTPEGALLLGALERENPRPMSALLEILDTKPNVRYAMEQALQAFGGRLVGNRVRNADEADLMHAASRLASDFLGISAPVLGVLESSMLVGNTRVSGKPLLLGAGIDRNVRLFHAMAEQLLMDGTDAEAPRCVARPAGSPVRIEITPSPLAPRDDAAARDDEDSPRLAERARLAADGDPLPASLGSYLRRHPRFPVDWMATFHVETGPAPFTPASDGETGAPPPTAERETPVRIFEVSQSGASIEALPGLLVGDRGTLVLHQIAGQPRLQVTVMDARRPLGRAGLRFEGSEELCARLALLASGIRR